MADEDIAALLERAAKTLREGLSQPLWGSVGGWRCWKRSGMGCQCFGVLLFVYPGLRRNLSRKAAHRQTPTDGGDLHAKSVKHVRDDLVFRHPLMVGARQGRDNSRKVCLLPAIGVPGSGANRPGAGRDG